MTDLDDAVTQRARARVGQVLRAKWRLDRLLGVGGMACVYAATHRNGKRGAVKMLHLELAIHEDAKSRFLREGYVANKVDHPGAVSVLDDDVAEDGGVFLVMELLEGESVEQRVTKRPGSQLQIPEVLAITDQLLDVLIAAHDKGVVHRDLKPENLFLTTRDQLKVLDFGIARLRELSSTSQATRTGSVMGTPAFMPPEQALGNWDAVDGRTDLWATGATMFRLLTGRQVHEGDTINKLLLAAMTKPAPPIQSVMPSLPPALAAIVDTALRFEQNERWPDARAMQRALREHAGGVAAAPPGLFPGGTASGLHAVAVSPSHPGAGAQPVSSSQPGLGFGQPGAVQGMSPSQPGAVQGMSPSQPGAVQGMSPSQPGAGQPIHHSQPGVAPGVSPSYPGTVALPGTSSTPLHAAPGMASSGGSLLASSIGSTAAPRAAGSGKGLAIAGAVVGVLALGGVAGFLALRGAPASQPAAAESAALPAVATPAPAPTATAAPADPADPAASPSAAATASAATRASASSGVPAATAPVRPAVGPGTGVRPPAKKDPFNKW